MKRILSACETKPETIEGTADYSELSESILTNQIKVDLEKIQKYAKQAASKISYKPEAGCYDSFLIVQECAEEVDDCFDALHKKINNKKRGRK